MKKIISILSICIFIFSNNCLAEPIQKIDDTNSKYLVFGKTNKYVKQLQEFLNQNGFNDCEEGQGSPGFETESFGFCTQNSIKLFQEYYKIPTTGEVDKITTEQINSSIQEFSNNDYSVESIDDSSTDTKLSDSNSETITSLDTVYSGGKDSVDHYNEENQKDTQQYIVENTDTKKFFPNFFEVIIKDQKKEILSKSKNTQDTYITMVRNIWNSIFKR